MDGVTYLQRLDGLLVVLGLSPLDLFALFWFGCCVIGYNILAGSRQLWPISLMGAIQGQRQRWMLHMAQRDDRVIDVLLMSNLASGNSFFASTSVILLGALSALLSTGEKAQEMLERIPFVEHADLVAWEIKVLVLMTLFI
jgi:uncharacterized membrane protein